MMSYEQRDRRYRWAEIVLTLVVSVGTSAVVVAWTVSSTLGEIRARQEDTDRRLQLLERAPVLSADIASLKARQDGDDQYRVSMETRLARIESKLDRALEGRR